MKKRDPILLPLLCIFTAAWVNAQAGPKITTPKEALGFNIGDDYQLANYTQLDKYWHQLATESDRMKLVDIGPTAENRRQYMAVISSPENIKNLDHFKEISSKLAHAEGLTDDQAHALAREGKSIVWIDGGLHATETVGSQQEIETVYELLTKSDPETMRLLNDDIMLCVLANPDGQELVANWYMRQSDPLKRSQEGLPVLFQHYIGHDNNRDFYMSNMPESTNMNHQMSLEWYPQIVYNHHQTGPAGAVIFMPPFRDPFNYNFDPMITLGVEAVGTAMHQRLVAQGMGGSAQRSGANYSTWWNGGLRTIAYFHNSIGILTEIIGNPTPIQIAVVPEKQLPNGDWPLPIMPQTWHNRQSIEYEMSNNWSIMDYASRNRETLLYDFYRMGANSIKNGSEDHWTVTPDRIEALKAAGAGSRPAGGRGGRGGAGAPAGATATEAEPAPPLPGGLGAPTVPTELYASILHDPQFKDARGYIVPSDQPDFATATKFINALLKTGITIHKASAAFEVAGKKYPAGSYVVKTAQAFRPHVMDMFEPQNHPNDFAYPGGPPNPPYDNAGWTLAFQMGVKFDRVMDGFDGPFTVVQGLQAPAAGTITGPAKPTGYLISHRVNDSFVVINRLMKAGAPVYWLQKPQNIEGQDLGTGAIWVPASSAAHSILEKASTELGVSAYGLAKAPASAALKLKPIRIGLVDQYGGNMPSGWDRWLFERYEFPFELVYPQTLDAGDLKKRFDVIVFTDGIFRKATFTGGRGGGGGRGRQQVDPEEIPEQYRAMIGRISEEKTIPQLEKFVAAGGSVVTIGSSTGMADLLGVPVDNYLTQMGNDGKLQPLPRSKYYIPGSLLTAHFNQNDPLAYGMPETADVFFDNSPVFKLQPDAALKKTSSVAWFSGPKPLHSGWAWGQQYLDGGTAVAEATVGEGKVFLLGPEVTFRGQPHGTFKLLFNSLYYGSAESSNLQ